MKNIVDKIFLINLDKDVKRLEEFDQYMKKNNFEYERFSAINGRNATSEVKDLFDQYISFPTFLTYAEKGCLLSHVTLWQKLVNDPDLNRILIFEDDARTYIPGEEIENLLNDFYNNVKVEDQPDMLYLGKALDQCQKYQKVHNNVYLTQHPLCLHAYIITKKGASTLLKEMPYSKAIDVVPIKAIEAKKIKAMTFHPSLFYQDVINNKSNLANTRFNLCSECDQNTTSNQDPYLFLILLIILILLFLLVFLPLYMTSK